MIRAPARHRQASRPDRTPLRPAAYRFRMGLRMRARRRTRPLTESRNNTPFYQKGTGPVYIKGGGELSLSVGDIRREPAYGGERLKCAAASATHPSAGGAAREPAAPTPPVPAAAPAAGADGLLGPAAEAVHGEVIVGERERVAADVPRGRVDLEPLEVEDPPLTHAQRDRPGQPAVQRVRGHSREPVLLRPLEKILEAAHPDQHLGAAHGLARHQWRERADGHAAQAEPQGQSKRANAQPV